MSVISNENSANGNENLVIGNEKQANGNEYSANGNEYSANGNENLAFLNKKYECKLCDYSTSRKFNLMTHFESKRHKYNLQNIKNGATTECNKYTCNNCNKNYCDMSGLWRHKKKCIEINKSVLNNKIEDETTVSNHNNLDEIPDDKQLILLLLKQNTDLLKQNTDMMVKHENNIKELVLELVKNGITNTNNSHNTNTNSNNTAFNLQVFLNETCKNAMNITDFVDSLKIDIPDIMKLGEVGYVEGISKIIIKNLNALDETKRPIHCVDKKRETMYIKDEDKWEKEDENKSQLKKMIKRIENKNIKLLPAFREKYPEYKNSSSRISDKHDKMVVEMMDGDDEKRYKIIRNISKVTTIDKTPLEKGPSN